MIKDYNYTEHFQGLSEFHDFIEQLNGFVLSEADAEIKVRETETGIDIELANFEEEEDDA